MKTKILSLCMLSLLALAALLALSGCDLSIPRETTTKFTFCQHENTEWVIGTNPRCEEPGTQYKCCSKCKTYLDEEKRVEPLGHDYVDNKCTKCNSFMISDKEGLLALAQSIAAGETYSFQTITLTADIDLGGMNWEPMSHFRSEFYGTFDGNGHTISNFKIVSPDETPDSIGFFAYSSGTIKNLTLEKASISHGKESLGYGGLLVGNNEGKIINCHVSGTVNITTYSDWCEAGGLVGNSDDEIINCSANVSVNVSSDKNRGVSCGSIAGGLAGTAIKLVNCYATGDVWAYGWGGCRAGGLVGGGTGEITNCYATGNVTTEVNAPKGTYNYAGGLMGNHTENEDGAKVTNCFATGNVDTSGGELRKAGGVIGFLNKSEPVNCYSMEGQTAYGAELTAVGSAISPDVLKTAAFQKDTLNWSDEAWSFTDGQYPTLKK